MPRSNEAFLLSGWLFADLLLALAVLFLAANTGGIKAKPLLPPTLNITPTILDMTRGTAPCTLSANIARCTITVGESGSSQGNVTWSVSNDISNNIRYSNNGQVSNGGQFSPGQSQQLVISNIPCQNGSFTFTADRITSNLSDQATATPVNVRLLCTAHQERLNFNDETFTLNVNNINALLNNDNTQINDIKQQIQNTTLLRGKSVGFAVVYDGAPTDNDTGMAKKVAGKIYTILPTIPKTSNCDFSRSSFYVPLYNLGLPQNQVQVDVYFFT
jgi:hypothetical protein